MTTKRKIMIAMVALMLPVSLISCKKDYTCTCTSTDAIGNESTQVYDLNDQTLRDADDACENFETDNAFVTRNCNL